MANHNELKTYEQVEAYVDGLDFSKKPEAPGMEAQADLAGQLQQICKYYKMVKPILQIVIAFPLIPEKIKKPIKEFVAIMDTLCP